MPSVSKTQYGTYRVLWYSGSSKKQKTFPTKTEAKKFAAALELSPEEKSSHISLAELLIEYRGCRISFQPRQIRRDTRCVCDIYRSRV